MSHSKEMGSSSFSLSFFFLNRPPVLRKNIPCIDTRVLFFTCMDPLYLTKNRHSSFISQFLLMSVVPLNTNRVLAENGWVCSRERASSFFFFLIFFFLFFSLFSFLFLPFSVFFFSIFSLRLFFSSFILFPCFPSFFLSLLFSFFFTPFFLQLLLLSFFAYLFSQLHLVSFSLSLFLLSRSVGLSVLSTGLFDLVFVGFISASIVF